MREPGARSIWQRSTAQRARYPALAQNLQVDCAVVGAGITGLTLAALLCAAGRRVAVIERRRIASGTTGSSSAHLTFALDTDYQTLLARFGEDGVRDVIDSLRSAFEVIEGFATRGAPDSAYRRVPGFRFCEKPEQVERLQQEAECARGLGLDVALVERAPLPFGSAAALRFEQQAELDPVAYCDGLARAVAASGGLIFEESPVVEADDEHVATADGWRVGARHVIEATHTPLGLAPTLQTRLGVFTSYCTVARLADPIAPGLYWDCEDPYHYLRALGDGRSVLLGGEDHRTGREPEPAQRLLALEEWLHARLRVESIETGWSHEYFEPADGLPYIGVLPGAHSHYVATGYSGTGLTFGSVAALLIRDLVIEGSSPWQEVYAPTRWKPFASSGSVARENLGVAWQLLTGRLRGAEGASLVDLQPECGSLTRIDGNSVAAYRDAEGGLHLMSPRCTHLGCTVAWNDLEKTWDCPCHGGRFSATGTPLYGPPVEALARVERPARREDEPEITEHEQPARITPLR